MFELITPPTTEPLTLWDARAHLRVDNTDEDTLISGLIMAARLHAESFTGRALAPATWRLTLDTFPAGPICLLKPLTAVSNMTLNGTAYTSYIVDLARSRLVPSGDAWTGTMSKPYGSIEVNFTAGYTAATCPEPIKQALLLHVGAMFEFREAVSTSDVKKIPMGWKELLFPFRVVNFT